MSGRGFARSRVVAIEMAGLLVASAVVASAPAGAAPATTTAAVTADATAAHPQLGPGGRVIVLFKNRASSVTARTPSEHADADAAHAATNAAIGRIRRSGGTVRASYSLINALSATVSQDEADSLAADPDVAEVVPDAVIARAASTATKAAAASAGTTPAANVCPTDPASFQTGPQALRATRANGYVPDGKTARSLGYDGTGVTVAFMAEGIDIDNPEFVRNGHTIFSDYQDFSGDGLDAPTTGGEAFLDASAIAAQGNKVYDISHFSALPLNRACRIKIQGEAPGVNLVGLKVFGSSTTTSSFLQAIQYAVTVDHVNILSQSFGGNPLPSTAVDAVRMADAAAIAAGVTVVASTGDAGITNTISSPADEPEVIRAGASTTYQSFLQTGYGGARLPGIKGWVDNNVSSLSSAGFDASAQTVTLMAPGELNYAACSTDLTMYSDCTDYAGDAIGVEASGGTSEAAPVIAGVAALVVQAYRGSHAGAFPSPAQVRTILTSSATDVSAPADQQGAGLVNAYAAVLLARAAGSTTTTSSPLVESSASSFTAVAALATKQTFTDSVTNRGSTTQTLAVSGRAIGEYTAVKKATATLSDASSPKYVDFQGITDNLEQIHFTVPAGRDRLSASIAWQAASFQLAARVRMTLVDPYGRLAAYSLPQGIGYYGHVEVARPSAGTWTAWITSRESETGGTEGPVVFEASVADFVSFGSVSPSALTLAPGQSRPVSITVPTAATPGDRAGSLVLTPSGGPAVSVPVTLRSVVPAGTQQFTQTLTGPNGRDEFPGVVFHYAIRVPAGTPELNAAVYLPGDLNVFHQAELVSPAGNAASFNSSYINTPTSFIQSHSVVVHALKPVPGLWTLLVDFAPHVSGTRITTPVTITVDDLPRTATAVGLPSTPVTKLKAGQPVTVPVKIRNDGPAPEAFFIDSRLNGSTAYTLTGLNGNDTQAPASYAANILQFLVPTHTTQLTERLSTVGAQPLQFDTSWSIGDPDVESTVGTTASASYSASGRDYVPAGVWNTFADQVGPFSAALEPESATATTSVVTAPFDSSVSSSTGDLWLSGLDPASPFAPVIIAPGKTATITVTITPTGPRQVVRGTLYVDSFSNIANSYGIFGQPGGSEVVALPYAYTVT